MSNNITIIVDAQKRGIMVNIQVKDMNMDELAMFSYGYERKFHKIQHTYHVKLVSSFVLGALNYSIRNDLITDLNAFYGKSPDIYYSLGKLSAMYHTPEVANNFSPSDPNLEEFTRGFRDFLLEANLHASEL